MQIQRLRNTAAAFVSGTQINHFISGMMGGGGTLKSQQSILDTHTKTADTIHVQKKLHLCLAYDTQNNKFVWHPNARHKTCKGNHPRWRGVGRYPRTAQKQYCFPIKLITFWSAIFFFELFGFWMPTAVFVSGTQINHFISGMGGNPKSQQSAPDTHTKTRAAIHMQRKHTSTFITSNTK